MADLAALLKSDAGIKAALASSLFLQAAFASVIGIGIGIGIGDSIMAGYQSNNVSALTSMGPGFGVTLTNAAVSGETQATELSRLLTKDYYISTYSATRPSIVILEAGTNDLGSIGDFTQASALYSSTTAPMIATLQAAGFYVIRTTILPRVVDGSVWTNASETQRQAYNSLVRNNSAGADAILDLAADPIMGDAGNFYSNNTLSPDGLHATSRGQIKLAALYAASVLSLLQSISASIKNPGAVLTANAAFGTGKFGQALTAGGATAPGATTPTSGCLAVECWASSSATSGLPVAVGQAQAQGTGSNFTWATTRARLRPP